MTKSQRAQVVELLRCAADLAVMGDRGSALGTAAKALDMLEMPFLRNAISDGHWSNLIRGAGPVHDGGIVDGDVRLISGTGYEFCLLEAARRVEEKSWP